MLAICPDIWIFTLLCSLVFLLPLSEGVVGRLKALWKWLGITTIRSCVSSWRWNMCFVSRKSWVQANGLRNLREKNHWLFSVDGEIDPSFFDIVWSWYQENNGRLLMIAVAMNKVSVFCKDDCLRCTVEFLSVTRWWYRSVLMRLRNVMFNIYSRCPGFKSQRCQIVYLFRCVVSFFLFTDGCNVQFWQGLHNLIMLIQKRHGELKDKYYHITNGINLGQPWNNICVCVLYLCCVFWINGNARFGVLVIIQLLDNMENKMKGTCVEGTIPQLFEGKMLVGLTNCALMQLFHISTTPCLSRCRYWICRLVDFVVAWQYFSFCTLPLRYRWQCCP